MKLVVPFFHSEFDPLQLLAKFFLRISTLWRFWRFSVATLDLNFAIADFLTCHGCNRHSQRLLVILVYSKKIYKWNPLKKEV